MFELSDAFGHSTADWPVVTAVARTSYIESLESVDRADSLRSVASTVTRANPFTIIVYLNIVNTTLIFTRNIQQTLLHTDSREQLRCVHDAPFYETL